MRVKILTTWRLPQFNGLFFPSPMEWDGVEFVCDRNCREYDWLVVYDELPREAHYEDLACPASHTILVTQEPDSIKIYPPCYTRQFAYVLTTHDPQVLRHPGYRRGSGAIVWLNNRSPLENRACREFPKSKDLSCIFSTKRCTHTLHRKRMEFIEYIEAHEPRLDRFGRGFRPLENKYDALDDYRYHIAIENQCQAYHWTEKLPDAILSLCLTFYAGDPKIGCVLPPQSFIPIPLDDPPAALEIIRSAIDNNEYEKRLPAIREARRLICERYNLWNQILSVIAEHEQRQPAETLHHTRIYERHYLRRNPVNLVGEWLNLARVRWLLHR